MIEITKPNRNNGIELLISDNDAGKKEEEINGDETDSVTTLYPYQTMKLWGGSYCLYLEHHFAEGDSAVVDQVGGVFDDDGRNTGDPYDVAGVENATYIGPLIRKFKVKTGNLDFANARGVGAGPAAVDDEAARKDWGLNPRYDLEAGFRKFLIPQIRERYRS